jgi:3,4-dihydroxy 2-butanone 4-phosphate synthase/GTP cyclohydrolase II
MSEQIKLDSIETAIEAVKNGEIIIVVDDEDRENEGDFICAAELVTPQIINFVTKVARGELCVSLIEDRCEELQLDLQVGTNTSLHETPFTVTVDLIGHGCTTGISTSDRAKTVAALVNPTIKPEDLARPGHVHPLKAKRGGVLRRAGHTEAAMDFARLAGLQPGALLIEILKEDGDLARLPDLRVIADQYGLKLVSIKDLIAYRLQKETLIERIIDVKMPTEWGNFDLIAYRNINTNETHLAIIKGTWQPEEAILVRVHSSCITGDIFGSCRCDCGPQLHKALQMIEEAGKGVVIYMFQEGRGIGLVNKLRAYKLQETGLDTVQANIALGFQPDERDYGIGAQILRNLNVRKMKLMSNNPKKRAGLIGYGLEVTEIVPIEIKPNEHNLPYLTTKRDKLGHSILKFSP